MKLKDQQLVKHLKNHGKNNLTIDPEVTTTTVNQLLTYIVSGDIDATIIWKDMTVWDEAKTLRL